MTLFRRVIARTGPTVPAALLAEIAANTDPASDIVTVPLANSRNEFSEDPMRNAGRVVSVEFNGSELAAELDVANAEAADRLTRGLAGVVALVDKRTRKLRGAGLSLRANGVPIALAAAGGNDDVLMLTAGEDTGMLTSDIQEIIALAGHLESLGLTPDQVDDLLLVASDSLSQERRQHLASIGQALDDGSYPIPDAAHLHAAAVLAASGHGDVKAARRLIRKRAHELGVDVTTLPGFGDGDSDADQDQDGDDDVAATSLTRDDLEGAWAELSAMTGLPGYALREAAEADGGPFSSAAEEAAVISEIALSVGASAGGVPPVDPQAADSEILALAGRHPGAGLDVRKVAAYTAGGPAPYTDVPRDAGAPTMAQAAEIDRLLGVNLSRPSYAGTVASPDERVSEMFREAQIELSGGMSPGDYGITAPSAADEIDRLTRAGEELSGRGKRRMPHHNGKARPGRRITSRTRAHTEAAEDASDERQPGHGGSEHPEVSRYLDMINPDRHKTSHGNKSYGPPDPSTYGQRDRTLAPGMGR